MVYRFVTVLHSGDFIIFTFVVVIICNFSTVVDTRCARVHGY